MKPTYDEVIEALSREVCFKMHDVLDVPVGTILHSEEVAKTALRALQDMMPEIDGKVIEVYSETSKLIDYSQNNADELYNHFKKLGRDD